jgi:predicted acylesterase/phospholipase RssA
MNFKNIMQTQILKSLSIHDSIHKFYQVPKEIDIVISVGGFYGFFVIGVDKILKKLEKENKMIVKRYSGSSVGAICAVLMACNIPADKIIKIYDDLLFDPQYFKKLRILLLDILPHDAYIQCTNKVFIYSSQISFYGLKKVVFYKFKNNIDLVDACMASSNMPYYVSPYLFYYYRGKYHLDGCFTTSLPVFEDEKHDQLLIKLYNIKYYPSFIFIPHDPSIEGLVVKGAIETDKFLKQEKSFIKTLCWWNKKKQKKSKKIKLVFFTIVIGISSFLWIKKKYK